MSLQVNFNDIVAAFVDIDKCRLVFLSLVLAAGHATHVAKHTKKILFSTRFDFPYFDSSYSNKQRDRKKIDDDDGMIR